MTNIPTDIQIDLLHTTAALEALVPEWLVLWQQSPTAKPFQHPAWLVSWWHHFHQPDLCVATIRCQGTLSGILPLYIYFDRDRDEHQLLLLGAGTSDYLDGIFAPHCTPDSILRALQAVAAAGTWQTAHLTQLLPQSPLYRAIQNRGTPYPGEPTSHCPARSIADLPKKVRAEVLYFRNAAIGKGELNLRLATAQTCPQDLQTLVTLHTAVWRQRGEAGVLADPAVLAWHDEAIPQLLAADLLRLYMLSLDGVTIAALYALIDPPREARTAYFYLVGHAPQHAAFKPGTLLTAMASEHAAREGVTTLDMLRGEEAYKAFWRVQQTPTSGFAVPRDMF